MAHIFIKSFGKIDQRSDSTFEYEIEQDGVSIEFLRRSLAEYFDNDTYLEPSLMVAIDGEIVSKNASVNAGGTVTFIKPLSGG